MNFKKWWSFIKAMFVRLYTDKQVEKRYVKAGRNIGDALSYVFFGEPMGIFELHAQWEKWEKEYARRGLRTISLDCFIRHGGYNKPLEGLGEKRKPEEESVFHAEIYRQLYLGKIKPTIDIEKLKNGEIHKGHYVLPTTELK